MKKVNKPATEISSEKGKNKQDIIHINEQLYSGLSTDELDKILEQSFTTGSCWAQTCPCKHLSPCECAGGREIYCDWYISGGL